MVELRTHDALPAEDLHSRWQALLERDPHATVFHGPDYLATWVETLGTATTVRIRTVHRGDELIGVIPESHEREGSPTGPRRLVRFLGGTEVTDYLGPVAAPEDREEVADAYLAALAGERSWDELVAGGLAADGGWAGLIHAAAERHGLAASAITVEDVCPRVDLSGGYDAYLDRLSGKYRREQGRKARKLARDAGELDLRAVPADELEQGLEVFFDMAVGSGDDKASFFAADRMQKFFVALGRRLGPSGRARLHILDVGGAPGAAAVSLVWDREWGVYNTAFDEVLASLAPGMVLMGELVRVAGEEGYETLDLLRGDEPYKYRFGAEDRPIECLTVHNDR